VLPPSFCLPHARLPFCLKGQSGLNGLLTMVHLYMSLSKFICDRRHIIIGCIPLFLLIQTKGEAVFDAVNPSPFYLNVL
jgi:hypothetical protein